MLIIPPSKKRKPRRPLGPGATGLQVLSATYAWGSSLTLVFNGAINIAGIVVSDFLVNDPLQEGSQYTGRTGTAVLVNATTVRMGLSYVQDIEGTTTTMTVAGGNGIYSLDDSQSYAGVMNMVITSVSP